MAAGILVPNRVDPRPSAVEVTDALTTGLPGKSHRKKIVKTEVQLESHVDMGELQ